MLTHDPLHPHSPPLPTCITTLHFTASIVIVCTTYSISSSHSLTCILRYICISPFFYYLLTSCKPLAICCYTMNFQCLLNHCYLTYFFCKAMHFSSSHQVNFTLFFPFMCSFWNIGPAIFLSSSLFFCGLLFSLYFSLMYIVSKKTLKLWTYG